MMAMILHSAVHSVSSGVPLGSILGTALFLIFINNPYNELISKALLLFAA